MRVARIGTVGLGVLLAARALVGCSSDPGEPGYDAGSLPDVALVADDAGDDAGVTLGEDSGPDATLPSAEAGGPAEDGGADTSVPAETDASDGAVDVRDASDGGTGGTHGGDASDGASPEADASVDANDAAPAAADASDGATGAGDGSSDAADASDASVSATDASDAAADASDASDASATDAAAGDDASTPIDGSDADDAAPACVSCGTTVIFLGNTGAYVSGVGTSVGLQGGTVPDGDSVSITTQTYPQGSVTRGNVHVLYSTDPTYLTQVDAPMTFDTQTANNDQWYVILPSQPAGTTVYWYVRADGCDCSTVLYDSPGTLQSYSYTEQ